MIERLTMDGLTTYGAYSQAVRVDLGERWLILLSGQLPLDANGNPVAPGDVGAQARFLFPQIERQAGGLYWLLNVLGLVLSGTMLIMAWQAPEQLAEYLKVIQVQPAATPWN